MMGPFDPTSVVRALNDRRVNYVVIGGYAAALQDAVWLTKDLDVLIDGSSDNLERLLLALDALHAEFDTPHVPPIRPTLDRLRTLTGPLLLRTSYGRLDVLRDAGGDSYDSVMRDHNVVTVAGETIPIASLEALLRMKRAANRPKDRPALALIEAAIARRGVRE